MVCEDAPCCGCCGVCSDCGGYYTKNAGCGCYIVGALIEGELEEGD